MKGSRLRAFLVVFSTFLLLFFTFVVGVTAWRLAKNRQSFKITILDVSFYGGGQICPTPLYDAQGNSYVGLVWGHYGSFEYAGPAPLFYVDPSEFPPGPPDDPCWYPEKIAPEVAVQGDTVFPLRLTVSLGSEKIRSGESTRLFAEAAFIDRFPESPPDNSVISVIPITFTEQLDVYFALRTTNFEYSPSDEERIISALGLSRPTSHSWIISPEKDSLGEQWLSVVLYDTGGAFLAVADVKMEVTDISGFNPTLIAILSSIGAFVVGLLGILRLIPETWSIYAERLRLGRRSRRSIGFKLPKRD